MPGPWIAMGDPNTMCFAAEYNSMTMIKDWKTQRGAEP